MHEITAYQITRGENGNITAPQPVEKLNSLVTMLCDLSEYEHSKPEG